MINHKDIIPLVRVEMSGLNKNTDLGTLEKEAGYEVIKNFINEKTNNIKTPIQKLRSDGCISLGKVTNAAQVKQELFEYPIYRGHIKNKL